MKKRLMFWALLMTVWLNCSGCTFQGGQDKEKGQTAKQTLAVETAAVTVADISQGVDVVGTLLPKYESDVKSEYLGVVAEVYVTEWVRVKRGKPLARLDTREIETVMKKLHAAVELARANLLEAQAAGGRAEREYERSLKLKENGLITQQNLEDAETGKAAARARVSAALAQLRAAEEDMKQGKTRLDKAIIRAPIEGVISVRNINVGDLVGEVGTPKIMFKIVDNRLLDLIVNVPSHETELLKIGQPLIFTTDAAPGKTFNGRIKFINPAVNQLDRSVKVIAEVPNSSEALKGGLFAQGKIITDQRKGVRQVPRTSLTSWDMAGRAGELFIAENGAARSRKVQTGIAYGDMVEITGGLAASDRIIVRGGFNLKDGDKVKITRNNGGI
jgi:RND family efflux transporter MFP subunit